MALELRQQLKLSQQLIMTPQLQMAIKLLQLNRLELMDTVAQELEQNPALEEEVDGDPIDDPESTLDRESEDADAQEVTIEEKMPEDIDWSNYLDELTHPEEPAMRANTGRRRTLKPLSPPSNPFTNIFCGSCR
jgi:RNA polymerase sigma-54 factor